MSAPLVVTWVWTGTWTVEFDAPYDAVSVTAASATDAVREGCLIRNRSGLSVGRVTKAYKRVEPEPGS